MFPQTPLWPLAVAAVFCLAVLFYILSLRNPKITTVVVGPLFLYLVSGIIGAAQLYFMGTMVLCVCIVSYFFSRRSLHGVEVACTATTPVGQGDLVVIDVTLENRDRFPKLFLRARCPLPEWLRADQDTFVVPGLWPGKRATLRLSARAVKRGCHTLAPVEVIGADPLDLFQTRARRTKPLEVVVHPVPDGTPSLELLGDDFLGTVAARRVVRPGQGLDFHSLRDYHPGDDMRTIEWKATARLARLIAVEFEPMQVGDLVVLLDNRAQVQVGRDEHSTLERAVSVAAGALVAILEARGTAHLRFLEDGGAVEFAGQSGEEVRFLNALARVEPSSGPLSALALEDLRGRTVLLITPGTDGEVLGLTQQIAQAGGRAVVLLLDAPAFARSLAGATPATGFPRWQRRLLEFLGFGPDGEDAKGGGAAGGNGAVPAGSPPPTLQALPEVDPRVEAAAGALRDLGAEVALVGPRGLVRQRLVREV